PFLRVDKPEVKGIHVTSWVAGESRLFKNIISLIDETELNTIVIDLKESDGRIAYEADIPLAVSSGSVQKRIRNLDVIIEECKRHNIYKIARIVLFKDKYLAEKRPDLAIKNKRTGGVWRDYKGDAFTNPYLDEVQDYNIKLAEDAARRGFDEIQFDYARFPSDGILRDILYPEGHDEEKAIAVITKFVEHAKQRLSPYNVKLSIDVFGLTTLRDDVGIGQNFKQLIDRADYVSPMIYPSHYWKGSYGFKNPNSAPHEIVKDALRDAIKKSTDAAQPPEVVKNKIRPWLQDFTLGPPHYGPEEVRVQIKAAQEHGINEWLLWNPGAHYTRDALMPYRKSITDTDAKK
ncbi:MAG: putative glycoside hydrolase, partial [Nitrospira sp.]|nr:putative glycoside hydrolase [Nitrospira sp.]